MMACPDLTTQPAIVRVTGTLRAPVSGELGPALAARVRGGERRVVLDLARVHDIDAAGVGELVRAYNVVRAAGGMLQIAKANRYVRQLLAIAGVYGILTSDAEA